MEDHLFNYDNNDALREFVSTTPSQTDDIFLGGMKFHTITLFCVLVNRIKSEKINKVEINEFYF